MKQLFWMIFLAFSIIACGPSTSVSETTEGTETETEETTEVSEVTNQFGEAIDAEGAVPYEIAIGDLEAGDSLQAKVVGTVEAVCQTKGCWMDIVSDEEGAPAMRVRFVDYGFFVPKDIAGRKVIMEGYAFREMTSVEDLRHYAEDAGKSQEEIEAITEPVEDLKFLASGVLLLEEDGTE